MKRILLLKNPIRNYSWGSNSFIPTLMGRNVPSEKPEAELWMGAHPIAPSTVLINGYELTLIDLIKSEPERILGKEIAQKFSNRLPFLFKVLAAAEPLSIQAHPNKVQAWEGFTRENSFGISLDAPNRNYKDRNHKPELICAMTPLYVLKGFRRIKEIIESLSVVLGHPYDQELDKLRSQPNNSGLKEFFKFLITRDKDVQAVITANAINSAEKKLHSNPVFPWMDRLFSTYPGDIGVIFPLMLNFIRLNPGEALYIPAGELHAYLEGAGIELMADSDNVLRGGLTEKHIDPAELMNIIDFNPSQIEILNPEKIADGSESFPILAEEFYLSLIVLNDDLIYNSPEERSVEILICTDGSGTILDMDRKDSFEMTGGVSVFVPADVRKYMITGDITVYKASVPIKYKMKFHKSDAAGCEKSPD